MPDSYLIKPVAQKPVWIGLFDASKSGNWSWTDGTPLEFENWGSSQPDNEGGTQYCAQLRAEEKESAPDKTSPEKEKRACVHQCPLGWTYLPSTDSCYKVGCCLTRCQRGLASAVSDLTYH
ncbi:C-type lectin domain family 4 member M-like protein [Aphelenchoides avenae]|nr:C-type lectin domain family 4 member M-like protein [Aphelenchus avenae]